jgi:SAM-dependent methyltransferase
MVKNILLCSDCKSDYEIKTFLERENHAIDAVFTCVNCGRQVIMTDKKIIESNNTFSKETIENFNKKYNLNIIYKNKNSEYVDFVEKNQTHKGKDYFSGIKKTFNLICYLIVWFFMYLKYKDKKPKNSKISSIIENLSWHYQYVPEMAIQKLLEIKAILNNCPEENLGTVLDIGGGSGIVAKTLLKGNFSTNSVINIDLFQHRYFYDMNIAGDFSHVEIKPNSLDTIISICVLEHIPDVISLFNKVSSSLRDNGLFIFTMPMQDYYKGLYFYRLFDFLGLKKMAKNYANYDIARSAHYSLYSQEEMIKALQSNGFKDIQAIPFFPVKLLTDFDFANFPAKLPTNWHFWGEWQIFLTKNLWLKHILEKMLTRILYGMNNKSDQYKETSDNTHLLYICRK